MNKECNLHLDKGILYYSQGNIFSEFNDLEKLENIGVERRAIIDLIRFMILQIYNQSTQRGLNSHIQMLLRLRLTRYRIQREFLPRARARSLSAYSTEPATTHVNVT